MGRDWRDVSVGVSCSVSRHNSEQDKIDDEMVNEIRERLNQALREITSDPRYASLKMYVDE